MDQRTKAGSARRRAVAPWAAVETVRARKAAHGITNAALAARAELCERTVRAALRTGKATPATRRAVNRALDALIRDRAAGGGKPARACWQRAASWPGIADFKARMKAGGVVREVLAAKAGLSLSQLRRILNSGRAAPATRLRLSRALTALIREQRNAHMMELVDDA